MKYVSYSLLMIIFAFVCPVFAADSSCECPTLACDPCSVEKGITFYSDKCGPGNGKVKSCARPTCVPIDQATRECPNPPKADAGPREPIVVAQVKKEDGSAPRDAAIVGKVKVLHGSVSIVQADGKRAEVKGESVLRENETVDSGLESGALLTMEGGNKVHVHGDTQMVVKEFSEPRNEKSRKALIQLIRGKVRNQVEQKYDGKNSYYKVVTKGVVAGVRGTDFIVEHSEKLKLETRVETLEGKVMMADLTGRQSRAIRAGEGAVFTADRKNGDVAEFVNLGSLSPVYKIPAQRLSELDMETRIDVAKRAKNRGEKEICHSPSGQFNQCSWRCAGNPSGESRCRVDRPGVACVRTRCNANGLWAEETRLPASADCPAAGARVGDCDY